VKENFELLSNLFKVISTTTPEETTTSSFDETTTSAPEEISTSTYEQTTMSFISSSTAKTSKLIISNKINP
jgi:hypothetical protein